MTHHPPMDEESYKKFKAAKAIERRNRAKYMSEYYYKFPNEHNSAIFKERSNYFKNMLSELEERDL